MGRILFAKKFGGVSGKDPDYLLLWAFHYEAGVLIDTSSIYLGDYRDTDSTKDVLLKDWSFLRLSGDSVVFMLQGTDTGQFGLNTPAYFAIDGVQAHVASVNRNATVSMNFYPNPALDQINIHAEFPIRSASLTDLQGRKMQQQFFVENSKQVELKLENMTPGIYFLIISTSKGNASEKLIISER